MVFAGSGGDPAGRKGRNVVVGLISWSGQSLLDLSKWGGSGGLLTLFGSGYVRPLLFIGIAAVLALAVIGFIRKGGE